MAKSKYEDEPVEYCLACGSLHVIYEESHNSVICKKCGAEDFTAMCRDINEYLKLHQNDSSKNLPH